MWGSMPGRAALTAVMAGPLPSLEVTTSFWGALTRKACSRWVTP